VLGVSVLTAVIYVLTAPSPLKGEGRVRGGPEEPS
jgi:hypothetical protein